MKPTYDSFVQTELAEAARRFREGHGFDPNIHDLAHFAWQRLIPPHREYGNWLLAAERKDRDEPEWQVEGEEPEEPEEPTPDWRPSREQVRNWSGDFLDALHNFERPTFMLPGMPPAIQREVLDAYPGTHVPFGWKTTYPRFPQWGFDHTDNFEFYEMSVDFCFERQKVPVCVIHFEANDSLDRHLERIKPRLDRLLVGNRLVALQWGWEINDINDWTCDGDAQLEYLDGLRRIVGPDLPLYVHWTPERWSGWPSFRNTIGRPEDEGGEGDWLREAHDRFRVTGMCYQEPWDKDLAATFERTYTYDKKNYAGPGICGRCLTYGLDFIFFEHSRDPERYRQVIEYAKRDGRGGWC